MGRTFESPRAGRDARDDVIGRLGNVTVQGPIGRVGVPCGLP
jgi:hypothetical protein